MVKQFTDFTDLGAVTQGDVLVGTRSNVNIQVNFNTGIRDQFGNYMIGWQSPSAGATNYLRFKNAVSGQPAIITSVGIDSNVSIKIAPKNAGDILTETNGDGSFTHNSLGMGGFNVNTGGYLNFNATQPFKYVSNDPTLSDNSEIDLVTEFSVKSYVDSHIATTNFFISTLVATTANISATYNNGASGVGATLTATSNGVASIDGISLSLGDIVLFKDQAIALQNGVYTVIQVGNVSSPAIYERYIYFDESAEIKQGYTTFTVEGNTNARKGYQVISSVNTIGVDAINYQQITLPSLSSSTDNGIVRFDGTSGGQVQNSGITITDADVLNGSTQINVDNIRLDGNTISSTDVNGPITIDPNGSGVINLNSPAVIIDTAIQHSGDTNNQVVFGTDTQDFQTSATSRLDISDLGVRFGGANARITSFSNDTAMSADSATLSVTQHAAKTYADTVGGASVTLTSAGGTETLVNDGTGPTLATKGFSSGIGVSLSSTATAITITNSAPDQTVTITNSNSLTVGGIYPNFTIGISASATSAGTLLRANGATWAASTSTFADTYAVSTLLYAGSSNAVSGLATANSAVLVTNSTGVPAMSGTMTNGQLIMGSTGATPTARTITAGTNIAITNGAAAITIGITGTIGIANGGTSFSTYTTGDTLYASATNTLSKLGIGSTGQILKVAGGIPSWSSSAPAVANALTINNSGSGSASGATFDGSSAVTISYNTVGASPLAGSSSIVTVGTITSGTWQGTAISASFGGTGQTSYTIGDILYASSSSALSKLADIATGNVLLSGGVATAPSWGKVDLTAAVTGILPAANGGTGNSSGQAASVANAATFNNSGSGDASGTTFNGSAARTISYNSVGASALAGSSSIVTVGTITSGTWHGTAIGEIYGGTNQTTYTTGDILYASASNTLSKLAVGSTGQVLTVAAGLPSWAASAGVTDSYGYIWMNTGNWTGVNFSFTTSYQELTSIGTNFTLLTGASNFAMTTDGRLKYTGAATATVIIHAEVIIAGGSGSHAIQIYKNGSAITGAESYGGNNNQPTVIGLNVGSVATNDYFSIFAKRSAASSSIIEHISLSARSV